MKRIKTTTLLLLCIGIIMTQTACTTKNNTSSSSLPEPDTQPSDAEVSEPMEESVIDGAKNLDYEMIVADLGSLTNYFGWKSPEDISSSSLIMWYGYRLKEEYGDDDEYMMRYIFEDADGLHVPAEEFEAAMKKYFGLESEHLRKDVFNEERQVYVTPTALFDLAEYTCNITNVTIGDTEDIISFERKAGNTAPESRLLTIAKDGENVRYLSYTDADGNIIPPHIKNDLGK